MCMRRHIGIGRMHQSVNVGRSQEEVGLNLGGMERGEGDTLKRNPAHCSMELAVTHCRRVDRTSHGVRSEQSGVGQLCVSV